VRAVEADARQLRDQRLVDVGQQALALGHAGQQREVGLGDAEGLVGAPGSPQAATSRPCCQTTPP
jgi:hypothetical protein